jgi:hypothetical protein
MNRLWRIKHWLRYKPSIVFWGFMAKLFHGLTELNDRLGYLLFGREKWEKLKEENDE